LYNKSGLTHLIKMSDKINLKKRKEIFAAVLPLLKKHYPGAKTELIYSNPLQILVATILSAQCTDERVNRVTAAIFKKYKKCEDYLHVDASELEGDIRSTGFYRNKAKNIRGACRVLMSEFGGKVPDSMNKILTLPGVARKTANVVLQNAYGITVGITVDTHVGRLARRMGLSAEVSPEKVERDLMAITDKKDWRLLSNLLISHGRQVCKSQKPMCKRCFLAEVCPSAGSFDKRGIWIGVK
jgi:endonuclease III